MARFSNLGPASPEPQRNGRRPEGGNGSSLPSALPRGTRQTIWPAHGRDWTFWIKKKKGQVEVIGKTAACFALLLRKDRGRVGLDSGSIIRRSFHTGLHSVWGRGDLTPLWSGQAPPESLRALSPFPEERQPRSVSHSHRLCCLPTPSALPPKLVPRQPSELHAWGMTSPAWWVRAVGRGQC